MDISLSINLPVPQGAYLSPPEVRAYSDELHIRLKGLGKRLHSAIEDNSEWSSNQYDSMHVHEFVRPHELWRNTIGRTEARLLEAIEREVSVYGENPRSTTITC